MSKTVFKALVALMFLLAATDNGLASVCPPFVPGTSLPLTLGNITIKSAAGPKRVESSGAISLNGGLRMELRNVDGIYLSFVGGSVGNVVVTDISTGTPTRPPFTIITSPTGPVIDIPIFAKGVKEFEFRGTKNEGGLLFACIIR